MSLSSKENKISHRIFSKIYYLLELKIYSYFTCVSETFFSVEFFHTLT